MSGAKLKKKGAQLKTCFKEGDISEGLIDRIVQLSGKYYSFG